MWVNSSSTVQAMITEAESPGRSRTRRANAVSIAAIPPLMSQAPRPYSLPAFQRRLERVDGHAVDGHGVLVGVEQEVRPPPFGDSYRAITLSRPGRDDLALDGDAERGEPGDEVVGHLPFEEVRAGEPRPIGLTLGIATRSDSRRVTASKGSAPRRVRAEFGQPILTPIRPGSRHPSPEICNSPDGRRAEVLDCNDEAAAASHRPVRCPSRGRILRGEN